MAGKSKSTREKVSDPASLPEDSAAIEPETETGADAQPVQAVTETVAPIEPAEETKTATEPQPEQAVTETGAPIEPADTTPAEEYVYNRSLAYGADGEDVKALQKSLTLLGHPVEATGLYDIQTVRAVQKRQKESGLIATGAVRKNEFAALLK